MSPTLPAPPEHARVTSPPKSTPTFSPDDVTVIFILGGPGSGKGTQCAYLVKEYGFVHLSAGDLLRAEQDRSGSQFGELIRRNIKEGVIVPMEVTVALLENAMRDVVDKNDGKGKFLIDGFPRKMDQALHFESAVCPSRFIIFLDCPLQVLFDRLLHRGKSSGRADDNPESISKRFRTFQDTSMPVVDRYESEGKVVRINAVGIPDAVHLEVKRELTERGFEPSS